MGAGGLRVSSTSILSVNSLGSPSARRLRFRLVPDNCVTIEEQHPSAKNSQGSISS